MIRCENIQKCYTGGLDALDNVSLHIERGELAFLTGHSGAGKSTLLKLIAVLERPTSGSIYLNNLDLALIQRRNIPQLRRQIGIIFQNPALLYDRSVFDNVALPLIISGYHPNDIGRRVRAALDKVGLLKREHVNPVTLSSGEQQRVGIARAIVGKPSVILADEPTGNVDPTLSREIMALFEQFQQVGVTCLIATHDLELIRHMPYRQLRLDHGGLVAPTPPTN